MTSSLYIKKLILHNWKAHKHREFDFSTSMNVLTGTSDVGKSAVLQAIQWCLTNKYFGTADEFRRWSSKSKSGYTKETYVSIELSDGNIIKRYKSSSANEYYLNDVKYTAFGTDVPDDIKKVFPVTSINFENQDDSKFLIALTPTEAGKLLNEYLELEDISIANKYVNSLQRENTNKQNIAKESFKEEESNISKIRDVLAHFNDFTNLEGIYSELEEKSRESDLIRLESHSIGFKQIELKKLNNKVDLVNESLEELESYMWSLVINIPLLEKITKAYKEYEECYNGLNQVIDINHINTLLAECSELKDFINETIISKTTLENAYKAYIQCKESLSSDIDSVSINKGLAELTTAKESIEDDINAKNAIEKAYEAIVSIKNKVSDWNTKIERKQLEIHELEATLTVCPTCGQSLKKGNKENA